MIFSASVRPGERLKLRDLFRSARYFVGIPTLLAAIYFFLIASDQYVAKAEFVIKSRAASLGSAGIIGSLGPSSAGASSLPNISDLLVVKGYVGSRQILEDIKSFRLPSADGSEGKPLDVRAIYSSLKGDWVARLNPNVSEEELVKYWNDMVTVRLDMTTGIASLTVRAFTPEEAKMVADDVLALSEALVNRLSERSQADALMSARREVEAANQRAMKALDQLQDFQEQARQLDPEGFAKARSQIEGQLETSLSQYEAQLETLRRNLPEDAPGIVQLKTRINVIQKQLLSEKLKSTQSATGSSASAMLTDFGKLRLSSEFATRAYMSALQALEAAQQDAATQSRYLEAFVRPQLPDYAELPHRILNVFLVFISSTVLWAIGCFLLSALKEHF